MQPDWPIALSCSLILFRSNFLEMLTMKVVCNQSQSVPNSHPLASYMYMYMYIFFNTCPVNACLTEDLK